MRLRAATKRPPAQLPLVVPSAELREGTPSPSGLLAVVFTTKISPMAQAPIAGNPSMRSQSPSGGNPSDPNDRPPPRRSPPPAGRAPTSTSAPRRAIAPSARAPSRITASTVWYLCSTTLSSTDMSGSVAYQAEPASPISRSHVTHHPEPMCHDVRQFQGRTCAPGPNRTKGTKAVGRVRADRGDVSPRGLSAVLGGTRRVFTRVGDVPLRNWSVRRRIASGRAPVTTWTT